MSSQSHRYQDPDALVIRRLHQLSPQQLSRFTQAQRPPSQIEQFVDQAPIEQIFGLLIHLLARLPEDI